MAKRDREQELTQLVRDAAAVVMLVLISAIVAASLLMPVLMPSARQDSTLLLGLVGSLIGALLMLLGLRALDR